MRTQILAFLAVVGGAGVVLAGTAQSQAPKNVVALQGSTPGISQSGHANISGIFIAGAFAGNGIALTNLNADNIASGTVSAARLPASLAYLIGPQTFTGAKTFSATAAFTNASAPFTVTSNSLVSNLNADLIDGLDSTAFASLSANQTWTGSNAFTNAANSFVGNGAGLTNLSAANIATGSVADARLSSNVALLNSSQTFSGTKAFLATVNFAHASVPFLVTGTSTVTNLSADRLDGLNSTDFVRPNIRIQSIGSSTSEMLYVENTSSTNVSTALTGVASSTSGNVWGVYGITNSVAGTAVRGFANAASGTTYGGSFSASSPLGRGVSANGGARGVVGTSTEDGGYGVEGVSNGGTGYGVVGRVSPTSTTSATYSGYFENLSGSGGGVKILSDALYGIRSEMTNTTFGSYAFFGTTTSNTGTGVYGAASSTTGNTTGGFFASDSNNGTGVFGWATADNGSAIGGEFRCDSSTGWGAYGSTTGANSRGVYGSANTVGAGNTPYGVYGSASVATLGSAVHASGDMTASGVKPFRIDHPQDPLNKYLFHYSSESPFPQNFYNGNVTTDSKGYAWVELPDYFEDINTNFKYQLTVMGETFAQAIVSRKIAGNRFQIRTNQPNTEVSWMVFADRNDARVQFKRPTDVREKGVTERGKYQHPEYYGAPASMGVDYVNPTKQAQRPR